MLQSMCSTAAEAGMPRVRTLQQEKPLQWETWALQLESRRCLLLVEIARTAAKAQESRKETN